LERKRKLSTSGRGKEGRMRLFCGEKNQILKIKKKQGGREGTRAIADTVLKGRAKKGRDTKKPVTFGSSLSPRRMAQPEKKRDYLVPEREISRSSFKTSASPQSKKEGG